MGNPGIREIDKKQPALLRVSSLPEVDAVPEMRSDHKDTRGARNCQ
jgi:hypothetical protein